MLNAIELLFNLKRLIKALSKSKNKADNILKLIFSSPEQKLRVSYCDHPQSVFDPILLMLRMFASMKSRSSSKLGHLWSKTRSPDQIKGKTC